MEKMNHRLTIRIGHNSLLFAAPGDNGKIIYEPYVLRSNMSMAANLREAFRQSPLLNRNFELAQVLVDAPALVVPRQEYDEQQAETLYRHMQGNSATADRHEQVTILHNEVANLNAVVIYGINSDLHLVVGDHFSDVRDSHLMQAVWSHVHNRSFSGSGNRLFAYFHSKRLEIFCFDTNRFRFCNSFEVGNSRDAVYYLLAVWKQLAFDAESDEIHLIFDTDELPTTEARNERKNLTDTLRQYVRKVEIMASSAQPDAKEVPFDLNILFEG
ncbi:MAG: DUF3822 family protein [Prevotella sp.]|nr:DUF3822 family protein [Prevotella sp.]